MYKSINSIQHVGVGVPDLESTWKWYRKIFGLDIALFQATADAPLMDIYTRNKTLKKTAAMVLNLQGGCAMELIQPVSETCTKPDAEILLGDYGIFITQIKTKNVRDTFNYYKKSEVNVLSKIVKTPNDDETFYLKDSNGLIFQIVKGDEWFTNNGHVSGGTAGCVIGVSDIDKSKKLYCDLLGYDKVIYDEAKIFDDWLTIPGGGSKARRVLLTQSNKPGGGFAKVGGKTFIELVQVLDRKPKKIYANRIWGDLGFVHLGFDVKGMNEIAKYFSAKGYPFTCDSKNILHMGNTRVHCTYIEDPDGTLLELIEVYRIPIVEKIGWFLNVKGRNPMKPLPSWILKGLRFVRVK